MSFNAKVIELLREKKMTKAELAKAAGVPYTTLDSMLKRSTDSERIQSVYKIAEYLGVSLEYLVFDNPVGNAGYTDAEKRFIDSYRRLDKRAKGALNAILEYESACVAEKAQKRAVVLNPADYTDNAREIPLYDAPAAAGEALPIMSEGYSMVKDASAPSNADFAIRISGDSMEPLIPNGSVVYVKKDEKVAEGEVGIFLLNGESLCKQLIRREGKCLLCSINPKYPPIKVLESDDLRAVGLLLR